MINAKTRLYNYFTIGEKNSYGQLKLPEKDAEPVGQVKIAIFPISTTIQDNINYKDAQYIGLTQAKVNDTYVIEYETERLKVLYINAQGKYTQVYLKRI
jgi:hypothetical protein